jgi:HEPN domain-containing protein
MFHAQQCVEKYLKALLVYDATTFPKTHDIGLLIQLLPDGARPALTVEEMRRLTDYATGARNPGWGEIPLDEAREAVEVARRVRGDVRAMLPDSVRPT